jgi:DNA polymerase III delta prime subunit
MQSILDAHLRAGKLLSGYLLIGSPTAAREVVGRTARELLGEAYATSPDYHELSSEKFGIDDAREVIRLAALRPLSGLPAAQGTAQAGGKKVFFLNVNGITIEAANALLKITEEPPVGTHFFLTTTVAERLPTTLRSRLVEIFLKTAPDKERVARFFALTLEKRLAEVKKMADRDRSEAENFLSEYEAHLAAQLRSGDKEATLKIEEFFKLKKLFLMPASYTKAILEGVAISAERR